LSFAVAALAGLALAVAVDLRLLLVGAACIAAGALYTGGPRPYGYAGFGEVAVLVFFGFVATAGSAYVQQERLTGLAVAAAVPVGLLACALLVVNNLRDIDTDAESGKVTLAVRLGPARTRLLYQACVAGALVAVAVIGVARPPALVALAAAPLALGPVRLVARRRDAPGLIAALIGTPRPVARPAASGRAPGGTGGERAVTVGAGGVRRGGGEGPPRAGAVAGPARGAVVPRRHAGGGAARMGRVLAAAGLPLRSEAVRGGGAGGGVPGLAGAGARRRADQRARARRGP